LRKTCTVVVLAATGSSSMRLIDVLIEDVSQNR
jgi:hypothetical protein